MNLKRLCTVLLPALALGATHLSARELAEGEWYLRLILTAGAEALEDRGNTLGQLNDALPEYDSYDLHELGQPFAGTYLSVIFHRPGWETLFETEEAVWDMGWEDFNSDYHPVSYMPPVAGCDALPGTEPGDEWTFEVRSDNTARALSLTWEGSAAADMDRMVLIDLQENVTVPAVIDGVAQEYSFTMNGAVRAFAWRLLSDEDFEATTANSEAIAGTVAPEANAALGAARANAVGADGTSTAQGSGWLPRGWSPDQGGSYAQPVPDGLPADPLAD